MTKKILLMCAAVAASVCSATPIDELLRLGESGDAEAQCRLYFRYLKGIGVERDTRKAIEWCRKAADRDYPMAVFQIALRYKSGTDGFQKDPAKADELIMKAVKLGNSAACFNQELKFRNGIGVPKNEAEAARWKAKWLEVVINSAKAGNLYEQINLALEYESGRNLKQDYREAVRLYRIAAEKGDDFAQYKLGVLLSEGLGVAQNHEEAAKLFKQSAEDGHPDAMARLAKAYSLGVGIEDDEELFHKWLEKSLEKGSRDGMDLLVELAEANILDDEDLIRLSEVVFAILDKDAYNRKAKEAKEKLSPFVNESRRKLAAKEKAEREKAIAEKEKIESEKNVARAQELLAAPKPVVNTLVFKRLYLGMPIDDARALMAYYLREKVEDGCRYLIKDGKVTGFVFSRQAVDTMFNSKSLTVNALRSNFCRAYGVDNDFRSGSRQIDDKERQWLFRTAMLNQAGYSSNQPGLLGGLIGTEMAAQKMKKTEYYIYREDPKGFYIEFCNDDPDAFLVIKRIVAQKEMTFD